MMTRRNYMNICMMAMFGTRLAMINSDEHSFVEGAIRVVVTIIIAYISAGVFEKMED